MVLVVIAGVAIDQYTKYAAETHIRGRGIVTVIDGIFDLRYSRNPGAFFSLGAGLSHDIRRSFFIGASLLAIALLLNLYRKASTEPRTLRWALMLLTAGAGGNLIDRVRQGEVTDFLHLHWQQALHWATFNVADIYIAGGLCLLVHDLVTYRSQTARQADTS